MKATDLLEKQHRRAEACFKKLEAGKGDPAPVLKQLADELTAHMMIEETIFYPAIRRVDEDMVFESFEEHAIASFALARLLSCEPTDQRFQARVTALKELIEHHVEEEEEELFPAVEKKIAGDALEELGAEMKAAFDAQVARGYESILTRRAPVSPTDKAASKEAHKTEAQIERDEAPASERRRASTKRRKAA